MTSKYSKRFTVPENFNEILQKLTREVLRDQPDDIIEYAALYFEALRDNKPFHYEAIKHDNVGAESITPQNKQSSKQSSKQPSKQPSQAEPSEKEEEELSPQASHHTQSEASELNGERGF